MGIPLGHDAKMYGENGSNASTMTPRLHQFMPEHPRQTGERSRFSHASSGASDLSVGSRSLGTLSPIRSLGHAEPVGSLSRGIKEPPVVDELKEFMPFAWTASRQRDIELNAAGALPSQEF